MEGIHQNSPPGWERDWGRGWFLSTPAPGLFGFGFAAGDQVDHSGDDQGQQQNLGESGAQAAAAEAEVVEHLVDETDAEKGEEENLEKVLHGILGCRMWDQGGFQGMFADARPSQPGWGRR